MVALLRFLDAVQVRVEVFLLRPRRAVDPLQHLVARIAAPVRAGDLHQLEHLELARRRHVRAAAEVDEAAFAIQRNVLVRRDRRDDLGLVVLAHVLEELHRLVARHHLALDLLVLLRELGHALLDRREVLRRERALVAEVVVEAVLDHRADRHLRVGKQLLDRVGEQVRRRMADDVEAFRVLVGDDRDVGVAIDDDTTCRRACRRPCRRARPWRGRGRSTPRRRRRRPAPRSGGRRRRVIVLRAWHHLG